MQQLNQSSASERSGSSVPEPLSTTGDALDKYQVFAEKVLNRLLFSCLICLLREEKVRVTCCM